MKTKRILSFVLSLLMCVSLLPIPALALGTKEEIWPGSGSLDAHKYTGEAVTLFEGGSTMLCGDANCDGKVDMADVVVLRKWLNDASAYNMKNDGKINADVINLKDEAVLDENDALVIQKYLAGAEASLNGQTPARPTGNQSAGELEEGMIGLSFPTVKAVPGSTVQLKVVVNDASNAGLALSAMDMTLKTDSPLKISGVSEKTAAYNADILSKTSDAGLHLCFVNSKGDGVAADDGAVVFTLNVEVPEGTAAKSYTVSVDDLFRAFDGNGSNISSSVCLTAGTIVVEESAPAPMEVSAWSGLADALNKGGDIKLLSDITWSEGDKVLEIPKDVKVTLDLNVHTIDRGLAKAEKPVSDGLIILNKGTLIIKNGTLTGAYNNGNGGAVFNAEGAAITLDGVTVTKNRALNGGGVYNSDEATAIINNSLFSYNEAGNSGGVIYNNSVITIKNCRFENNQAGIIEESGGNGGGIYNGKNVTLNLSGSVIIIGNTAGDMANNVYLSGGTPVNITAPLDEKAVIGVTTQMEGDPVVFTAGLKDNGAKENFVSDDNSFKLDVRDSGEVQLSVRTPESVTVTFHKNDGSDPETTAGQTVPYNTETALNANTFTNGDLVFVCWNTEAKPTETNPGTVYTDKASVKLTEDLDLYAQWRSASDWALLARKMEQGGEIKLEGSVSPDFSGDSAYDNSPLTVPKDVSVTLDLNGFTIDRKLDSARSNGCVIKVEGALTITDSSAEKTGKITGGNNQYNAGRYDNYGGGVYVGAAGEFTLEGGTITGSKATAGDGVYIDGGSFTMKGGSITGNTGTVSGVSARNNGSFTMSGGSITDNSGSMIVQINNSSCTMTGGRIENNKTTNFGAVYLLLSGSSMKISGAPVISGSVKQNGGTPYNVYLLSGKKLTVTGELDADANIGVTMKAPGVFTDGLNGRGDAKSFTSDEAKYTVTTNDGSGEAELTPTPTSPPQITGQPEALTLTYCYTSGSLTVDAACADDHTLSYQWYSNTTDSTQGASKIEDAVNAAYDIPSGRTAGSEEYYFCVVTAARTDNGRTSELTSDVAKVTVNKAPVTIKALDKEIYVSSTLLEWNENSYTVTGLMGDDTLETAPTVEYRKDGAAVQVDMNRAGEYEIWPQNAKADNYEISYAKGTLTVSYAPSGDSGSYAPAPTVTVIPSEHGKVTVVPENPRPGQTVTVKLKPEEGYVADWVTVTDKDGNKVKVTKNEDGTYSYTEPEGGAKVKAEFLKAVENPFEDVLKGDYFCDPVIWALEKGVIEDTGEKSFGPEEPCTRSQVLTFIWKAAGCPKPAITENPFNDVSEDAYYYQAILWAYEQGITRGNGEGGCDPDETVTRGDSVTFIYRALGGKLEGEIPFEDVDSGDYCFDAVLWAFIEGVTNGTDEDSFSPGYPCQRAHIITFLYRAYHM
ncbi:MAG: S-layer homology domain-containing protein [Oscillospiraceae bacterium]|nr:S-layer homology domain-containing protein [Oscillospiraceae bacterium]